MKVEREKGGGGFEPFTLKIVVESKEEAMTIHSLFNYPPICKTVRKHGVDDVGIREVTSDFYDCGFHHKTFVREIERNFSDDQYPLTPQIAVRKVENEKI